MHHTSTCHTYTLHYAPTHPPTRSGKTHTHLYRTWSDLSHLFWGSSCQTWLELLGWHSWWSVSSLVSLLDSTTQHSACSETVSVHACGLSILWMCVWVCVLYLLVLFRGVLYLLFCRSPLTGGREPAHDLNSIDGDLFACQPYLLRGVWLSSVHFMVECPNVLRKLFTLKTVVWMDDVWDFHNEHHLHLHVRQLHF